MNPLTVDDMITITSVVPKTKAGTDDVSLIVHVDDTQSEIDAELDAPTEVAAEEIQKCTNNGLIVADVVDSALKSSTKKDGRKSRSSDDRKKTNSSSSSAPKSESKSASSEGKKDTATKADGDGTKSKTKTSSTKKSSGGEKRFV